MDSVSFVEKKANSLQSEPQADSQRAATLEDDSYPTDELARAKQAMKAWQNKANSLQKRNELLETEIMMLKNQSMHPMTNGDDEAEEEAEAEPEGKDEDNEVNDNEEDDEDEEYEDEEEDEPLSRKELEKDLENTREQLAEMTELYEELLRQRNNEIRLRRYSTVDNQSAKSKLVELQVQMEQLKAKHTEELLKKDDELKIVEERADRDRSKATTLRKELENLKNEKTNLLLDKKKLERSLQKVYSAKQKRREQAEDSIKEIEVSTLKLKNNRLQKELQKAQTSPPPSIYGSQENLLDSSLSKSQEFGLNSVADGLDQEAFPSSVGGRERELETEVDSLREEVQTLQMKLSTDSEQNKVMVEHWEQQLTDSDERAAALEIDLTKANQEIEMLTHELEMAETTADELSTKLEESEAELAEKLKQREDELDEINDALEDAQGQLRNVPSDTVLLQQKLIELQQELDETRKKLGETKKQLDKEIIAVSWKNQEIAQLQSKLQQ